MKAIEQVVHYLRVRGALSHTQFAYLEREGFWPRDSDDPYGEDSAGAAESSLADGDGVLEPEADEDGDWDAAIQRSIAAERRRGWHRRRAGGSRLRPAAPADGDASARPLCAWIAKNAPAWRRRLGALSEIGRRLGGSSDAQTAILGAAPDPLDRAVADALGAGRPELGALWTAVSLDDYARTVPADARSTSMLTWYRMVIGGAERAALGRYAWLLKEPEVRRADQRVQAQRRVLGALGRILAREPALCTRNLRRLDPEEGAAAYLAFAIVHNARRFEPAHPPMRTLAVSRPPLGTTQHLARAFNGPPIGEEIAGVAFSPDGNLLAGGVARDTGVRVWDPRTGRIVRYVGLGGDATAVAWSHDSKRLAAGDAGGGVQVMDVGSRRIVARARVGRPARCLAFSADGQALFFSWGDGVGRISLRDGRWTRPPDSVVPVCEHLAASRDGARLAIGGGNLLGVFDLAANTLRRLRSNTEWVHSLALSPDGDHLASAGMFNRSAAITNAKTGELEHTLDHDDDVTAVGYAPDGAVLATGGLDGAIRLWSARTGAPLGILGREKQVIRSVAVGGRGELVATATETAIRLWNADRLRREPGRHFSERPLPDRKGWLRAWSQALVMDPAAVPPFAAHYFANWPGAEDGWIEEDYRALGLATPREWDR